MHLDIVLRINKLHPKCKKCALNPLICGMTGHSPGLAVAAEAASCITHLASTSKTAHKLLINLNSPSMHDRDLLRVSITLPYVTV